MIQTIKVMLENFQPNIFDCVLVPMWINLEDEQVHITLEYNVKSKEGNIIRGENRTDLVLIAPTLLEQIYQNLKTVPLSLNSETTEPAWKKYNWAVEPVPIEWKDQEEDEMPIGRLGIKDSGQGIFKLVFINAGGLDIDMLAFERNEHGLQEFTDGLVQLADAFTSTIPKPKEDVGKN